MLSDTVPERALAVYAHPDDPEISAGGTIARWARAGCEVHLVITTRGDKGSNDPHTDPDALAARRRAETEAAAAVLGISSVTHGSHPDGELPDDASLRALLCAHVRRLAPQVLLCPDPTAVFFGDTYFNHRDHRVTGWAALEAVAPAAGNPHYFPEQLAQGLRPHQVDAVYLSGTMEPNCWVDISEDLDTKIEALFRHTSQLAETGEWFRSFLRERAEAAGVAVGVPYAEAFRRLTFTR